MTIGEVIGISGFILSVITFFLTRLERRKSLIIHIYCDNLGEKFIKYDETKSPKIVIQIANNGTIPIFIDNNSIKLVSNKEDIKYGIDWLGFEDIPVPLNPGNSCEIGIYQDIYEKLIEDENIKKVRLISELKDLQGKKYKTRSKYFYISEVGEIEKN